MHTYAVKTYLLLLFCASLAQAQFYQGYQMYFGKSRVRYKQDWTWLYYKYPKYDLYLYEGGQPLAEYISRIAQEELKDLEDKLGFSLQDKVDILLFNRLGDFRQSNIGLQDAETELGGVYKIIENKLFVYYEGSHDNLRKQLRAGLGEVLFKQLLYRGFWRENFVGETAKEFPAWYVQGLTRYLEQGWTSELDDALRQYLKNNKAKNLQWVAGEDAAVFGAAIWHYIEKRFNKEGVSRILYTTRHFSDANKGLLLGIGYDLKTLQKEVLQYYKDTYQEEQNWWAETADEKALKRTKKSKEYSQFVVHQNGKYGAFVAHEKGQYQIFLLDMVRKKKRKIFQREQKTERIFDKTYPVLAFNPKKDELAFAFERKGLVKIGFYDVKAKKIDFRTQGILQKILDMVYSPSGEQMLFTAVKAGQSDLFLYQKAGNGIFPITESSTDKRYPIFISENEIAFATHLPANKGEVYQNPQWGVFGIKLDDKKKKQELLWQTGDSLTQIKFLQKTDKGFAYLGDQNGIFNLYERQKDSAIARIDTVIHYRYTFEEQASSNWNTSPVSFSATDKKYARIAPSKKRMALYLASLEQENKAPLKKTFARYFAEKQKQKADKSWEKVQAKSDNFQVELLNATTYKVHFVEKGMQNAPKLNKEKTFTLPESNVYSVNFSMRKFDVLLDNNALYPTYQRFHSSSPSYNNPSTGGLFTFQLADLFEDHHLMGGFKLGATLSDHEIVLSYKDLSKRLSKEYILYKQTARQAGEDDDYFKNNTYLAKFQVKYPFTEFWSLGGNVHYRFDERVTLSTDLSSLRAKSAYNHNGGAKVELVFDNILYPQKNIYYGSRVKVFGEYFHELTVKKGDLFVVGLDARHYQKIHRNMILAMRLAWSSSSFGHRKLIYYLGGMDGDFFSNFKQDTKIDYTQNYYFQATASPLRGFDQNVRNGNNMLISNLEWRFPFVSYFSKKPIKSEFLRDLQLIGFADFGMAWSGLNPYSTFNTTNQEEINRPPLLITLYNQQEPIILSFGTGLRISLFGYFLRLDLAWSVQNWQLQRKTPFGHLSLQLDF